MCNKSDRQREFEAGGERGMGRSPVLSVGGLEKAYGRTRVLEGVDLEVGAGEFVVLLGPAGAGKSTLLGAVAGLVAADRGRIAVLGHDLAAHRVTAAAVMGIVFEDGVLDPDRSLVANLLYHSGLHGLDRRRVNATIAAELERLGLGAQRRDAVRVLGPANRRRVELVRALLHEPAILMVDEGSAGLDGEGRRQVLADARAAAVRGMAVIWATHRPDEAGDLDRLAVLDHGRIVFDGNPGDFVVERGAPSLEAADRTLAPRPDDGDEQP